MAEGFRMSHSGISKLARIFLFIVASVAFSLPAASQVPRGADMEDLVATMERLSLNICWGSRPDDQAQSRCIPMNVYGRDPIRRHLGELARERCDQQAIADLGGALEKTGYRREAVTALVSFSKTCGGHAESLRTAANILLTLSDYATTVTIASRLIELEPFHDNGYYLRAVAHERGGSPQKAIDDYTTAIELFGNKQRIASVSYQGIARSYEKLGHLCDAASAIEAWVSINPARNDTSQTRAIIATYLSKAECGAATASREEVFAVSRPNNVVKLPVLINGIRGFFILDTGATFVSLKATFAQKSKVRIDPDSALRLYTANGITTGKRGRADAIRLRSLQAKDVPIVVQDDAKGTYGEGVDGLLGMSFLSRFKLTMDARTIRLSAR
jgi:clan AA aspartic protease (TIGR02281 family)